LHEIAWADDAPPSANLPYFTLGKIEHGRPLGKFAGEFQAQKVASLIKVSTKVTAVKVLTVEINWSRIILKT
jgi:hypothetical protein